MSMNGHLLQIDPTLLARAQQDPSVILSIVERHGLGLMGLQGTGDEDAADLARMLDATLVDARPIGCLWMLVPGFLRRWLLNRILSRFNAANAADAATPGPTDAPLEGVGQHLALHKDWNLLHFALTGASGEAPGPAGDVILGGDEVGEDLGYGPARVLMPEKVATVAAFLGELGPAGIMKRFDPRRVPEDVYGADFARERATRESLRVRAEGVCRFYREAAEQGQAVLLWLD